MHRRAVSAMLAVGGLDLPSRRYGMVAPAGAAKMGQKGAAPAGRPVPRLAHVGTAASFPAASPRLVAAISSGASGSVRMAPPSSTLPLFSPRTVSVKTLCNGTHTLPDLAESATIGDIAHEMRTRLMLPPWRGILLTHWGRELRSGATLVGCGLSTGCTLDARIRYCDPDPSTPLTRVRLTCTHLVSRHVAVSARTLVRDVKAEIHAYYKKGAHVWCGADGSVVRKEGATLLCKATKPADPKNLTTSMKRGEQMVLAGFGGDKKDKWRCVRTASGHAAQIGFDDAVKLDLPPKAQALTHNGVALADDQPLSAYSVRHDDALVLSFENPALVTSLGKKPPPKKK